MGCSSSPAVRGEGGDVEEEEEEACWLQLVSVLHVVRGVPGVIEAQLPPPAAAQLERIGLLHPAVEEILWELVAAFIGWEERKWVGDVMALLERENKDANTNTNAN